MNMNIELISNERRRFMQRSLPGGAFLLAGGFAMNWETESNSQRAAEVQQDAV
jgi:hypothetical protein